MASKVSRSTKALAFSTMAGSVIGTFAVSGLFRLRERRYRRREAHVSALAVAESLEAYARACVRTLHAEDDARGEFGRTNNPLAMSRVRMPHFIFSEAVDWRMLPRSVMAECRKLARESDAHELSIVDGWSTNVSNLLLTFHKMKKLCGHLGYSAWNLAAAVRSVHGLPAAVWLDSEWDSVDLLKGMSDAYAFTGDPDDDFELDPVNPIGGMRGHARKPSALAVADTEQNRLH